MEIGGGDGEGRLRREGDGGRGKGERRESLSLSTPTPFAIHHTEWEGGGRRWKPFLKKRSFKIYLVESECERFFRSSLLRLAASTACACAPSTHRK